MATKKTKTKTQSFARYIIIFWSIVAFIILSVFLLFIGITNGLLGPLPSTEKLENPDTPVASVVYSADGEILGKYFKENRMMVRYEEISPNMINALIATEDARYFNHAGIDPRSLARVMVRTIIMRQRDAGGGSTISQQLAKNLFHTRSRSKVDVIKQKLKEWVIAVELERKYTKEEILAMYLNTVDFGSNAHGIRAASRTFFNKNPNNLNIEEAAILVGVLKATTAFSPVSNPDRSLGRRNVVINQMANYGYITKAEEDSLQSLPIVLDFLPESHATGLATYFREVLRMDLGVWSRERGLDLYSDGLVIHTTIDSRMQRHAEKAVAEHMATLQKDFFRHWSNWNTSNPPWKGHEREVLHSGIRRSERYNALRRANPEITFEEVLKEFDKPVKMRVFSWDRGEIDTTMSPMDSVKYYKMFLRTGFMAMEPNSGHVKAWVGGTNYKHFKYDQVNVRAKRQVGSTFKPFVFAAGILHGYSPCFTVANQPVTFEDFNNWTPKNYDNKYGGVMTIRTALARSINVITAYIMKQVGPPAVIQIAKKMGITSTMESYPSIALGTMDISVYEMVGAYNTFTNGGVFVEPIYISRIEDRHGNLIQEFVPKTMEALSPGHNYVMLDMLKSVVTSGTAGRLKWRYKIEPEVAGKTGTTQRNSDGWFIGMVADMTAGAWVGAEDRAVRFRSTDLGGGANMALPIFGLFMQKVYNDSELNFPKRNFPRPDGPLPLELDCSRYVQRGAGAATVGDDAGVSPRREEPAFPLN